MVEGPAMQCENLGAAGSTNMRLVARLILAIVVTVLAALVLYFVFLQG